MIIIMKADATQRQSATVVSKIEEKGLKPVFLEEKERRVIAIVGDDNGIDEEMLRALPGVERVMEVGKPYKMVSKDYHPEGTVIDIKGVKIGSKEVVVSAGPCSIESEEQIVKIAREVKAAGAKILRGGAFKWRTSPHSFQGLGLEGLHYLKIAKQETGLISATEVLDPRQVEVLCEYTDILQVGTISMQNYPLLKEVGKSGMPVILKRGKWANYNEFLLAAEYILAEGNEKVILCERGIRTFVTETRHTVDINAIPYLKRETHLPIMLDPSHGTGIRDLVPSIAKAGVAAGADGLLIEAHYDPKNAASDADQTISTADFGELMKEMRKIALAVGRNM